ncbi:MAG: DUF4332 domain-containing protein [Erysipelothrix sp.]|jgi:predicted flap endonuclease-1-like 5' DNA nuclease|nr:DUF4332 domain-containing protein [Erysipelothrix sp.]
MPSIVIVEGIGPAYQEKLNAIGIFTTEDYIKRCATKKGRVAVAEESGISEKLILTWANHIDLFRIKGVREQFAELLEAAGVDTVVELAQRNPENLYEKLKETNAEKRLVRRLPGPKQVEDWIAQAAKLPRLLEY